MIFVYTDGSCSNNGKKDAAAGIGVYFGPDDPRNVSRRVDGKQSNNTAELGALLVVYEELEREIRAGEPVTIVSDSVYAIRSATEYGAKHAASGWSKDIPNKSLVRQAYELFSALPNVQFMKVAAHTGARDVHSIGNENADLLANMAIGLTKCPYERVYLNVPFEHKDDAKAHGARWDPKKKRWWTSEVTPDLEKYMVR
jgi:ribonuclease HI